MPPKADINRSGSESTDFPSVCENCLPENPYVQMIKENYGAEFVRDAALKLVAQGPSSEINKQYYAQNTENHLTEGQIPEEYEKTDSAARDLLKRLATSEPYYKRPRRNRDEGSGGISSKSGPGPIRTRGGGNNRARGGGRGAIRNLPSTAQLPPGPQDIEPPMDKSITSLFLLGVEDDLAEHAIRTFFSAFGQIRSIVCVHHSRSAFVNFQTRAGAEAAAESCQGKAIIAGCPLRIMWGKPRPLGNLDRAQVSAMTRPISKQPGQGVSNAEGHDGEETTANAIEPMRPPGTGDDGFLYPSQRPE
ncbi:hypothetical protein ABW20_dc0106129 [Dactylellina cionopaga]|nr:hypothetical protein ABW20_dc0106129 [Dactylellina cionopaga]